MIVRAGHVHGARQSVFRIEILQTPRRRRTMPRNHDSRQTALHEFVAINQVPGGSVVHQWPGIDPDGISEVGGLGWIINIRFTLEEVLWIAVRAEGIEVAVQSVASLVVGI